jgi:acyl-CoA thioesterase-1
VAAVAITALVTAAESDKPAKTAGKKRKADEAFAKVEDRPGLPRVLLIGDSISIGYTVAVQQLLKDKANVHRNAGNAGPTTNGLKNLRSWLGDSPWDVIHFNWGLHDLKYISAENDALADPKLPTSRQQVPLQEYEKNLRELVKQLQATGAKLIWCSTTPVPAGSQGRVAADEVRYNEAAARVMREARVEINDLCSHARAKLPDIQLPANVHFSPEGSRYLAEKVAAEIEKQLPGR